MEPPEVADAARHPDARLSALVAQDHEGFILAHAIAHAPGVLPDALVARAYAWFDRTLLPHFELEERVLIPALCAAGDPDGIAIADRLLRDHTFLCADLLAARSGDVRRLRAFAALLLEHVRFEQKEAFPVCARLLPESVLDRVAAAERDIRTARKAG
jgi:hypothetical protein